MHQNNSQQENDKPKSFDEILGEVSENSAMVTSKAWGRVMEFVKGWEQDAFQQMIGNESKSMAWAFQNRWKQREALVRGLSAWADNAVKQRDQMIQEMQRELEIA